jgi:hypothetical protein
MVIYELHKQKMVEFLLILVLSFSLVSGIAAQDTRVRLTIPPEQAPDPAWRREFFKETLPLKNRPQIVSRKKVKDEVHVTLKNTGETPLEYYGTFPVSIQLYQEIFRRGLWRKSHRDWCCLGKEKYMLLPGQSIRLEVGFSDEERGERLLGEFREAGTNRCGLIVLATEV